MAEQEAVKQDYRCGACRRLLFRGYFAGEIQVLCPRCREYTTFDSRPELTTASVAV